MPRLIAALVVAVVGGFVLGKLGTLETVLLGMLGYLVGRIASRAGRWPSLGAFVLGGGLALIIARVPFEPSVSLAVRSVALNPVIVLGLVVGARLIWLASAGAPSTASRPAQPPARTPAAGTP